MVSKVDPVFWYGKKVLLTGHTGFKGSWLSTWLTEMGAEVKGYALSPPTTPSLFKELDVGKYIESEIGDIRNLEALTKSVVSFNPDILIHMAAQPLVRKSYTDPVETYSTNVMGTVNILEASRKCSNLRAIVNVTTDKCYENNEWVWGYRENDRIGGVDPYSSSKSCSEIITSAYEKSFFSTPSSAAIATARAGNVIGGGDWAEDRLIPDILRAFEVGKPVLIRNQFSTRPWQHVLEPLSGYLILAERLFVHGTKYSGCWNFGPRSEDVRPVEWILEYMIDKWGGSASWNLDNASQPHEALYLKLDTSKAQNILNWYPKWALNTALNSIIDWHKCWLSKEDMHEITINQIRAFCSD